MLKTAAATILVLFAMSAPALAGSEAEGQINVVVDENYPPYAFKTAGQASGLYVRLIEGIFSRSGMTVKIRALPWGSALKAAEEGSAAIGGIYQTRARLEIYDYSEPLFEEHLVVYVNKGNAFPFTQLSDLQGRTIGLNRAWSYGDEFDAARAKYHFTVEEADSNLQNFRKLVAGRIDCLIADRVAASQLISLEKWGDRVEALDQPVAVNPAYLAVAKQLEKRRMLERFNRALADMKKDGSYGKLVQGVAPDLPAREMRVD